MGAYRTNDGKLIANGGNARQQFTNLYARYISIDGLELTPDINRCIGFWIKGFVLGWPTLQPKKYHILRFTKSVATKRIT